MDTKVQIKISLVISLLFSIVLYHVFEFYWIKVFKVQYHSIASIYKVVQLSVTATFFVVIAYAKWMARLLLRSSYVGGAYKGRSSDYTYSKSENTFCENPKNCIELFVITQNLFDTRITGWSWRDTSEGVRLLSTWEGRLVKFEGNTVVFAVELTTTSGEYGVLKATFNGPEVHGFYFSGEPNTKFSACFSAKKVSPSEIQGMVDVL